MTTPHIIFLHGMGEHTKENFLNTFFTPIDKAAGHFSCLSPLADNVVAHYIDYNERIKDVRKFMGEASIDSLNARFPGAPSIVAKINKLNNQFAHDDSFWFTHFLDVAIYRSFFADAIKATVGKQLVQAMQAATNAKQDIHIVCHSLGTAVGHDVLHALYTNSLHDEQGVPLLSAGLNKIRSITMVANVCAIPLPITTTNPYNSVVKSGKNGICDYFLSCRHILDPFASIFKFKPENYWSNDEADAFKNKVIKGVERANVHDMDHYFNDPSIFVPFFMNVYGMKFKTKAGEMDAAIAAHAATTVQGKFDLLKKTLEDADITVYWDADEGEFVFSNDLDAIYEQLTQVFEQLKTVKDEIGNLTNQAED